jgi:hypothetical protein
MGWLARAVEKLDKIAVRRLLWTNLVIAALVLVAHGGALAIARTGKAPEIATAPESLYLSIALALAALMAAVLALARPAKSPSVMKLHAVWLLLLLIGIIWTAIDIMLKGVPKGATFTWNPVLFFFLCAYPVYLARRAFVPAALLQRPAIKYSHVIAGFASLVVSVVVIWKVWATAI